MNAYLKKNLSSFSLIFLLFLDYHSFTYKKIDVLRPRYFSPIQHIVNFNAEEVLNLKARYNNHISIRITTIIILHRIN